MGFRLQRSPNPVVAALINSFQRMENISLIINIVCPILGIFMLVNLLASGSKPSAAAACIAHVGSVQQSRGPDWALSAAWCSDCHPLHRNGFYHRTSRRQKQQTSGVILPRSAFFWSAFSTSHTRCGDGTGLGGTLVPACHGGAHIGFGVELMPSLQPGHGYPLQSPETGYPRFL